MEPKKKPEVDITRKSALFFNIGLIVALGLTIMAFEWKTYDDSDANALNMAAVEQEEVIDIPLTEIPPPPPPKVQQPEVIEVPDEEEIEDIEVDLEVDITEETKVQEVVETVAEAPPAEEEVDEIFLVVEEQPAPEGGMEAFNKYLSKNLRYPEQARRMGIEGRVFVEFVVDKDGSLNDVKAVKGIGAGCDEEAVRVVKAAPKWKPGKQRGRPVRVRMVVPIFFKMG
ncbi:protein TonB [Catalinimonas alkaloidigena]|uniref:Protein TonB n=1 Tax=Catalinimonas alkaloidigena TaxID=1075417 RepID=A0A1G9DRF0_9BACT|nr:energy transducer TonB [Catalinimonas alkaloidigena]SDK66471.1 protein TonB [Catalinimonas alkaloidigena]